MPIRRATFDDAPTILAYARRAELYSQRTESETLDDLLRTGVVTIGAENGQTWGLCAVDAAQRPASLPDDGPAYASVALLAVQRAKRDTDEGRALLRAALDEQHSGAIEFVHLCREPKLGPLLRRAGFTTAEEICFMRLTNLRERTGPAPEWPADLRLTYCTPDDIDSLVQLDAAAFPARWHIDRTALITLSLSSHVRLLWQGAHLAGYGAITIGADQALLDRIAVSPACRGRGFGDLLMDDLVEIARQEAAGSILLNTQNHNRAAQALYRRHGFRFTGHRVPVYTLQTTAPA